MKKFKSLFYMLALALIFVGAAGMTKAYAASATSITWNEAENNEYTVTVKYQVTDEADPNCGSWVDVLRNGNIPENLPVQITVTPGQDYTVAVTAKEGTSTCIELTRNGNVYSFTAGNKYITLELVATEKQAGGQGGSSQTPESGGTSGESSGTSLSAVEVVYEKEYIEVTSDKQVFFQLVKAADTNEVKAANWIKAAVKEEGVYVIDYSGTANTKDVFYAFTTNSAATKPDKVVTVDAVIKSAKITLNYKTEILNKTEGKGLYEIIGELTLKPVEKGSDFVWDGKEDLSTLYTLNWKRGANGTWATAAAFDQMTWDMVKASNSTLYINVSAQKGTNGMVDFRPSKETKLKVPKSAKAPNVKVDYVKGMLALKNGMQVRVNDNEAWLDVVAYDKAETTKEAVFALATAKEVTKTKVSAVAVADLVAAIRAENLLNTKVEDGAEIKLEVRTAATDKKFASNSGFLKLVLPEAEPAMKESENIRCTAADKANDVKAEFEIDFTNLMLSAEGIKYEEYEYALVGKIADGVNLVKQKWTKIPSDGKVDLSKSIGKEYSWFKEGEDKATKFKYEDMDGILVRKAAVKATKEVTGVFASAYRTIDVTVMVTESENSSQNPGDDTEWDIKEDSPGTIGFIVDGNQVEKAKPGTKVTISIFMLSMSNHEVDKVTVYTHYETSSQTEEVIEPDANGAYIFTMPTGHVTVVVSEKEKES